MAKIAITAHEHAREIHRETGNRHREGTACNNLGLALRAVRRFDEVLTRLGARHRDLRAARGTPGSYTSSSTIQTARGERGLEPSRRDHPSTAVDEDIRLPAGRGQVGDGGYPIIPA